MSTGHLSSVFTGFVGTFLGYKEAAKQRFRESARPEANCSPILNEFFVSSMTDLHSRLKAYIHAHVGGDFGGGDPNDTKPNISGSQFSFSYSTSTNNIENVYQHKKYRANAQTNVEDSKNVQTRDDAVPVGSPSFFIPNSRTLDARAYVEYNSSDELKYSQTREHAVIAATLSNNNQNSRTLDSRENAESILSAELKNVQIGEENSVIASTLSNNYSHSRVRDARANAVANAQLNAPAGSEYSNILFYSYIPNSRMLDARADAESNSSVGLGNIQIRDDAATISTPSTVAQNCRNYSRANARTYDRSNAVAAPKNATTKNGSVKNITNASSSSLPNLANAQPTDVIIKDEVDEVRDNVPVDLDSLSPFSSTNAHRHRIMMMQKNALSSGVSTTVSPTTTQENGQRAENGQILDSGHHHSAQYQSVLSNLKVIICNAPPNNNAASSNVSYWRNSIYAKANQQDQLTNGHENGSSFFENARARNNASHNASSTTTTKNCDSVNSVSKVVVKEEVETDDESPAASSTLKNAEALACAQMLQDNARLKARAGTVERNNFQRRMPQTRSALNAVSVSAEALAAARQEYARKKDRENAQKNAQQNGQQNALRENARANAPNDASSNTGASSCDARGNSRVNAQENASTRNGTVGNALNIVPPMPLLRNALENAQKPSTSAGTSSSMCDQMLNNAGTNDFNPKPSTPGQDVYPNSEPSTSRAWIRARANVLARNVVSQPPKVVTQPEPHLSFTYAPHPNLDLYDDDFDVQEGQEEQGRDPNLPEFPPIEHYRRREPSPCPLDSDHEFERLWRSDDELAPENVRADPDYRPSRGKKLGPRTPRVVAKSQANKRPRVVNAESGEQDEEELDEAGSGTPAGSKKRNVASPRADGGGNDKMKVKIVELNCSEDNCEVTVPSLGAFNHHLLVAHGIRSCRCYVEGCAASYESKSDMSEHIRVAHARLRQWPCCRCSKHFLSYPTLRTHQLTHQAGVFQCETCAEECGYTASNRMKVYGHIRLARKRAAKVAAASGNVAAAGEGGSQIDSFVDSQDSALLEDFPLDD